MNALASSSAALGRPALRFPSAAQRALMRAAPGLPLPPPAPVLTRVWKQPAAGRTAPGGPVATARASSSAAVGVPVAAMEAVMIERMKHFDNGHDLASDVVAIADNPRKLSRRAERFIVHAIEDLQFHKPGYQARARHHIAQAAAMLLAFYDAIEATPHDPSEDARHDV